ncbi:DBB domain-containing protein stumps isoform 2-T2 [Glossina fuscipes fuscipes]
MFVTVDNQTNTLFSDNPYYFYNDPKSPRTPDSQSSSKGFSIFKRRNSKGNSPRVVIPEQTRLITSANLDTAASLTLGSPRGNFGAVSGFAHQTFELQPLMQQTQQQHQLQPQITATLHQRRARSSNSHSETFRERLSSCHEANNTSHHNFEQDDVFSSTSPSKTPHHHQQQQHHHHNHHHHHHHTLPSAGARRHSFSNWRQASERHHTSTSTNQKTSAANADEVPQMMAPRPPILSPTKYRGLHKRRDNCGTMSNSMTSSTNSYNMDDILIVTAKHSERAILRANFLKNHFDKITKQRGRKPFNFLHIKIEDGPFSEQIASKYQNTALQIVILCPALLALSHSLLMSQLSAIVRVEKVLGILLDVADEKVKEVHKTALPNYLRWRRCAIRDNDQAQISNILGIATDILGRALCQRPVCNESAGNISRSVSSCSDGFTILPRKVKIGQNKVVAMLNEPLERDDILKITVEKSGELIELRNFKCRNPYTVQFAIPESCMEISTMIEIRIEKNDKNLGARPIKCESRLRELEQLLRAENSPIEFMCHALGIGPIERDDLDLHLLQCFQKNMPPNFHLLNGPYEKQHQHQQQRHHHLLSMRETSPEEYPTLLHFAARWGLTRLCMQLLECPGGDTACGVRNCSGKTPAELAESEGHHKLARNIMSFSEFHELTTMYHYFKGITINNDSKNNQNSGGNKCHNAKVIIEASKSNPASPRSKQPKSPSHQLPDKATNEQPTEYMEMSSGSDRENTPEIKSKTIETRAITNLNYISVEIEDENSSDISKNFDSNKTFTGPEITSKELLITEPPYYSSQEQNKNHTAENITDSPYQTDKFSHECSQLLENCSDTAASANDYVLQPSNIPVMHANSVTDGDDGNYLTQPSNIPVEEDVLQSCRQNLSRVGSSSRLACQQPTYGTLKRTGSNASSGARSTVDDELAEIMHDFKNNVLSIREVEVLVEKWKHRNDVQQSFREKQEQIDQLRKEYERIQDQMRTHLKRDTPFDKFKKLFSRHKSSSSLGHEKNSCIDGMLDETKSSITTTSSFKSSARPISSLSLQSVSSSSSSGRLSTGSNCSGTSLGDSGTHSDHEERRFGCRLGSPGTLTDNYLVPPPPRPIFTPNSTPGDERHQIVFPSPMSSCTRLNSPTSPLGNEHYQMFPSNIPVYNSQSTNNSQNSNSNYLNTIMEANHEPDHNYQNQSNVTLQPIKLNEKSNIIYGKLNKITPNCSSFKPATATQKAESRNGCIEVQAEVYQNVGSNLNKCLEEAEKANGKEASKTTEDAQIDPGSDSHNYINC